MHIKTPLPVLLVLLYIGITVFYGSFIESYEIIYASAVGGEYIDPIINDYETPTQFLLLALYAKLCALFPSVNVFGWSFALNCCLSLLFLCVQLKSAFDRNGVPLLIFVLVVLFLFFSNVLHLSSTRIAFLYTVGLFLFIHRNYFISTTDFFSYKTLFTACFSLYISLIRFEVVILVSLCCIALLLLTKKRLIPATLVPLFTGALIFLFYHVTMARFGTEASKAFYFFENQIEVCANYENPTFYELTGTKNACITPDEICESLRLSAIVEFGMLGKGIATVSYLEKQIKNENAFKTYLFGRFSSECFFNSLELSFESFRKVLSLLAYLTIALLFIAYRLRTRSIAYQIISSALLLFAFVFPLLLNAHILTPKRFLAPYYMLLTAYCIMLLYKNHFRKTTALATLSFLCFSGFLAQNFKQKEQYRSQQEESLRFIEDLNRTTSAASSPFAVIEYDMHLRMFSRSPFKPIQPAGHLFMNDFFDYKAYYSKWGKICACDATSMKEKINFISQNNIPLIIHPHRLEFLKNYLLYVHKTDLTVIKSSMFRPDLLFVLIKVKHKKNTAGL